MEQFLFYLIATWLFYTFDLLSLQDIFKTVKYCLQDLKQLGLKTS